MTVRGLQLLAVLAPDQDRVCHLHAADAHPAAQHADCYDGEHIQPGHLQVREGVAATGTSLSSLFFLLP